MPDGIPKIMVEVKSAGRVGERNAEFYITEDQEVFPVWVDRDAAPVYIVVSEADVNTSAKGDFIQMFALGLDEDYNANAGETGQGAGDRGSAGRPDREGR